MIKFKKAGERCLLAASLLLVGIGVLANFNGRFSLAAPNLNIIHANLNSNVGSINTGHPNLNISPIQINNLNGTSTDAIAIRIIPNPDHLSIDSWYASQKFSGSPQKLLVDGYEAIRDNRTVYVAATNIDSSDRLYFNIYIITYNQGATAATVDVFGKILSNWRFNNNLSDAVPGTCSLPSARCGQAADCSAGFDCQSNYCISPNNCRLDTDCPAGTFCTSQKSKLQRDLKRFNSLREIREALNTYHALHRSYPSLISGTYLPSVTISTWPSWRASFLATLNLTTLGDPINKLGVCNDNLSATSSIPGFESQSCFNPTTGKFYQETTSAGLELPLDSSVIAYTSDRNGSSYNLCATMETGYQIMSFTGGAPINLSNYNCTIVAPMGYSGSSQNNPAQIVAMNLSGQSGEEFNGYVLASDPEGNPINFQLDTSSGDWSTWSAPPVLRSTNNPNQKKIWAASAGNAGSYPIKIEVKDNQQAGNSTTTNLIITGNSVSIDAGDAEYEASTLPSNQLNYDLYFTANDFSSLELSYSTSLAAGFKTKFLSWLKPEIVQAANLSNLDSHQRTNCLSGSGTNASPWLINSSNCSFNLNNGLRGHLVKESENGYHFYISGTISNLNLANDTNLKYHIKVNSSTGQSAAKDFKILVKKNAPKLDYGCSKLADLYENYSCQISNLNTSNASTTYTFSGLPQGLTGTSQGLISGQPLSAGSYQVQIEAKNEYDVQSTSVFDLKVENACGRDLVYYQGGPWDSTGEIRNQGGYYRTVLIGDQCFLADNLNVGARAALSTNNCSTFHLIDYDNDTPSAPDTYINGAFSAYVFSGLLLGDIFSGLIVGSTTAFDINTFNVNPNMNFENQYHPGGLNYLWNEVKDFFATKLALAWNPSWNLTYNPIGTCYNSNTPYCDADGRLYTADEVLYNPPCIGQTDGMRGPCPAGWHVPTDSEWHRLEFAQSINSDPGETNIPVGFCSSTRNGAWDCQNSGTKLKPFGGSGFDALMAGRYNNLYQERTISTYYWSSTKVSNSPVYYKLTANGEINKVYRGLATAGQMNSLRCIKDKPCPAGCASGQYCSTLGQCTDYLSTP